MKNKSSRTFIIIAAAAVVALFVIAGTAVSVYAYLQLTDAQGKEKEATAAMLQEELGGIPMSEKGVLVTGVQPESPAAQAGLRRGSIILEVDGIEVNSPRELQETIGEHEAGDSVTLTVLNCDSPEKVDVTLASSGPYLGVEISGFGSSLMEGKPENLPDFPGEFHFGPHMGDIPGSPEHLEEMEEFFRNLPEDLEEMPHFFEDIPDDLDLTFSAVIVDVVPDGPAAASGLEKGDKIVTINGVEVNSPEEAVKAISSHAPGDEITLGIERQGESMEITVALGSHPENEGQAYLGIYLGSAAPHREFQQFEEQQNS